MIDPLIAFATKFRLGVASSDEVVAAWPRLFGEVLRSGDDVPDDVVLAVSRRLAQLGL